MDKDTINARLKELQEDRSKVLDQINRLQGTMQQANANLNAFDGAIQDCQYWLSQMEEKVAAPVEEVPSLPTEGE